MSLDPTTITNAAPQPSAVVAPTPPPPAPAPPIPDVPYRYPADDLVAAAGSFGVRPEVVRAALFLAQLTAATRDETQAAITAFMTREV